LKKDQLHQKTKKEKQTGQMMQNLKKQENQEAARETAIDHHKKKTRPRGATCMSQN